ncbi:hypothetical protein HAX54_010584 [Datura stramonium]|uniref:Uncharacterized protein n=1 Tax=Datura stramonium TaxID=4076 RepID=A0ABS8THE2_DATST|nr:hypothetical protein [Datura stramonium]
MGSGFFGGTAAVKDEEDLKIRSSWLLLLRRYWFRLRTGQSQLKYSADRYQRRAGAEVYCCLGRDTWCNQSRNCKILKHWAFEGAESVLSMYMEELSSHAIAVESRVQKDAKVVTSRAPGTAIEYAVALVEVTWKERLMKFLAHWYISNLIPLFYHRSGSNVLA